MDLSVHDPPPRIMILMNPARGYDRALMRGMARYVHTVELVMVFQSPSFWEQWDDYSLRQYIDESRIDGLILIEQEALDWLQQVKVPMVVSPYKRRRISGVVNLVTKHKTIGQFAADHLLRCGFKHFAFCEVPG